MRSYSSAPVIFTSMNLPHSSSAGVPPNSCPSYLTTLPSSCGEQFDLTVSTEIILFQTRRESTRRGSVERLATRIAVSQIDDSQRLAGEIEAGLGRSSHLGTYNKGLRCA